MMRAGMSRTKPSWTPLCLSRVKVQLSPLVLSVIHAKPLWMYVLAGIKLHRCLAV